jgi:hypothetical protein
MNMIFFSKNCHVQETSEAEEAEATEVSSMLESSVAAEDEPLTPTAFKTKKRPNTAEKRPKNNKRKAEETPEQPPPAKQAKTNAGKTSRSGRALKENKIFVDESPVKSPVICLLFQV